jgi:hypothetical protein
VVFWSKENSSFTQELGLNPTHVMICTCNKAYVSDSDKIMVAYWSVCAVTSCPYRIQGDSGGICNTLRNDSVCDSKQKILYEHGSDFGQLRSYYRLKLTIEGDDC